MTPEERAELLIRHFLARVGGHSFDMMTGRFDVDLTPNKSPDYVLLLEMIATELCQ